MNPRLANFLCIGVCALCLGLCACSPTERTDSSPDAHSPAATGVSTPLPSLTPSARIEAFAGQPAVIPLAADAPLGAPRIHLDDGVDLKAREYFLTISQAKQDPWMGPIGDWSASVRPQTPALRVAVFTLPPQAKGQGIWINDTRHDVLWLLPPETIAGDAPGAWQPAMPAFAEGNTALAARLRDVARSPLDRFRVRLLLDGMRTEMPPTRFDDPTIEALAMHTEQRLRAALARVFREDAALCTRLKQRLSAVADFGQRTVVPAWSANRAALERLISDLLNAKPGAVALRAEQFLAEQPQGVVWVADDAPVLAGESAQPLPTIGVANFTGRDVLARAYLGSEPPNADFTPIPAFACQLLTVSGTATIDDEAAPAATVKLGKWSATIPVAAKPIPVTPPGLIIGPLIPDLTMQRWLYAQPAAPLPTWSTSALLFQTNADAEGGRHWALMIECHTPEHAAPATDDRVSVFFGPPGAPAGYMSIDSTGRISRDPRESVMEGPPQTLPIQRTADRWSCIVPLPDSAIEFRHLLRLGLTRRDPTGTRTAWPRPLLPWQEFPSRALVRLDTWTGFEQSTGARER